MTVATQIKKGNIIKLGQDLFKIIQLEHITPGKGNAIVQTDLRNVKTGVKTKKRFRSSEDVETVALRTRRMQYLYEDRGIYHFMDQETCEQYELDGDMLAHASHYVVPENVYEVDLYENLPIGIRLPQKMALRIVETAPPQKGVTGKTKAARLETGFEIKVPLFIAEGESVIVNTDTDEYVARAK